MSSRSLCRQTSVVFLCFLNGQLAPGSLVSEVWPCLVQQGHLAFSQSCEVESCDLLESGKLGQKG